MVFNRVKKKRIKSSAENVVDEHGLKRTMGARIRGYFLAGILVTAPIGITVWLTIAFLGFIDSNVKHMAKPLIKPIVLLAGGNKDFQQEDWYQYTVPGLGIAVALFFFIMIGWFATNILGRWVYRLAEYIVHKMPFVSKVYGAVKQIMETILASQSQAFREVVMLEYPRKGVWSIGFITGASKGEVQRLTEKETVNVFVPTTPNPTSGYLLFVPRNELHFLDMTVEEGVKLVVSAGIISPPDRGLEETHDDEHESETK